MDLLKLSEFIGIMLGDGYFTDTRLKVSLNPLTDSDYIEYVCSLMNELFCTEPILKYRKNENCVDIFIFKRRVLRFLDKNGLRKSPKWERAIIPESFLQFDLKVLRGYFDTDGCVVVTNNNGTIYPRLEMKISPSPMQWQFIEILKKHGFNFGVYDIGRKKVRIQLNGIKQLEKWSQIVGFSNRKHFMKSQIFLKK